MKYSVIIPIYQAEKTIERCLDSLVNQNESDVEILLIDDGSTDRSRILCQDYCRRDRRFHYYFKENGGVSSARNYGLDIAEGDYILFIDGDDFVSDRYFDTLNGIISMYPWELVLFSYEKIGKISQRTVMEPMIIHDEIDLSKFISSMMHQNGFGPPWYKMFVRSIIEKYHLRFIQDLSIAEDLVFSFSYTLHVNHAFSSDQILYYVDESNANSLSRKERTYLADHLYRANEALFQSLAEEKLPRKAKTLYRGAIKTAHYRSVYSVARENLKANVPSRERKKTIRQTCKRFTKPFYWPESLEGAAFAFPVIFRLSEIIDYMVHRKVQEIDMINSNNTN